MPPREKRRFDIVLFGATGFTGRLVADYLASASAARTVRWALAGRDADKLRKVRDELVASAPHVKGLEIVVGDALDPAAMRTIAADTRVVCTTVGPYGRYGSALVEACAAEGTDYCDLTGEAPWIRRMIDAHDATAKTTGARIVHCCGFDSIPSDLGVQFLQQEMQRRHGHPASQVSALFQYRGGTSGGTIASMLDIFENARDPEVGRALANPYALDPDPDKRGPDRRPDYFGGISYDRRVRRFTAPFLMAAINTRIVRRSNALAGYPYGEDFRYREVTSLPGSPKGLVAAVTMTAGLAGFGIAATVPWLRKQLAKRLPKPGEGPNQEQRERGYFLVTLIGERNGSDERVVVKVGDRADPGYGSTCKMLGESALCLAFDNLPKVGGVLTPATAMGPALAERLRKAGFTFEAE